MNKKIMLIGFMIVFITAFFIFDLNQYLTFDYLQDKKTILDGLVSSSPIKYGLLFFILYLLVTALSLPGAALMTLAAGALFGLFWGVILVSFASTLGATIAFLLSRFLFRDAVQKYFYKQMSTINKGIEKEGRLYLFSLRMIPLFPFFVINLVMGITKIPVITFFWVSQIGMLAGTIVYINAGTQLAILESAKDIISVPMLLSFALLGVFPILASRIIRIIKRHIVLSKYEKPKQFDRNLIVIGGGSAGLVAAYIAAAVKSKVTLVEKLRMGGDCLNTGCVPSKALIRSARFIHDTKRAKSLGFDKVNVDFSFDKIMSRVHRVIGQIAPHDSRERYSQLGVECLEGKAKITSPYTVEINGKSISSRAIIVATGARPFIPHIEGLEQIDYLTSDSVWELKQLPKRLIVLGGGPIGCELAQAFSRLGSSVTLVEMGSRILPREDYDVSSEISERIRDEGINLRVSHTAKAVKIVEDEKLLVCDHFEKNDAELPFDEILIAIGRQANTSDLGLEEMGIQLRGNGTIETDEYLQTSIPTIYASGDVTGPYQFTHTAAHQSWYASVNALFGFIKKFKVDYSIIPWTTFVDPEVARVGLNVQEAKEKGIDHEVTIFKLNELDRAITEEAGHGFIKILTVPGKDIILGVTIVGKHAGELIAEYVLAMKHSIGLNKILGTIHIYPTMAEANKYAAGAWKRDHAPTSLLRLAERLHNWRLGPNDEPVHQVMDT